MKIQLPLFFAFVTPVVLLLGTILYGNVSLKDTKKAITQSGAYEQIAASTVKPHVDVTLPYNDLVVFFNKGLTPEYIKTKTESAIDDSANWISGATQTPPTISLKEIKEELQKEYPDRMSTVAYIPSQQELNQTKLTPQEQKIYLERAKQLNNFANSDFTLSITSELEVLKTGLHIMHIALPVLIIFLIVSLYWLVILANSPPLKFLWVGLTLMISSIVGYAYIFFHLSITSAIIGIFTQHESIILSFFSPILVAIINHYMDAYVGYQEMVSVLFLFAAAGCFIGAIVTRKQAVHKIKPVYEARSYWETPLDEKSIPQATDPAPRKSSINQKTT